jgi:hypothetical protein
MNNSNLYKGYTFTIFRIIFYCCSVYFFLMGTGLALFPQLLVKGLAGVDVNPAIIGMLRGAGGAIIPYSLIYILVAQEPLLRRWGLSVIALANIVAIALDLCSVFLKEYKLGYAMMDLPVELLSLAGIIMIWIKIRNK